MSRKTATVANLIHQYVAISISIINGIVLVPLYLKYIDYRLYGAWLATGSIVAWLTMVDPGLTEIVQQQIARIYGARDFQNAGRTIGTGLFCLILFGILPIIISAALAPFLPYIFTFNPDYSSQLSYSFFAAGLSASLVIIAGAGCAVLQGLQRNIVNCIVFAAGSVLGIILTVIMLVKGYGLISIPAGLVARGVLWLFVYWIYALYICVKVLKLKLSIHKGNFRNILGLTSWNALNKLSLEFFGQCDALVVGLLLGVEITPIFVLSKRAWDLLRQFLNRISVAFIPALAHLHGEGNNDKFRLVAQRLLRIVVFAMSLAVCLSLALNKSFVNLWVGENFYAGDAFNILMALGTISLIYFFTINRVIFATGQIKSSSILGASQNLLTAVFLVPLIYFMQLKGAGLSLFLGYMIVGLLFFIKKWVAVLGMSKEQAQSDFLMHIKFTVISMILGIGFGKFIQSNSWFSFVLNAVLFSIIWLIISFSLDNKFREETKKLIPKFIPIIK